MWESQYGREEEEEEEEEKRREETRVGFKPVSARGKIAQVKL